MCLDTMFAKGYVVVALCTNCTRPKFWAIHYLQKLSDYFKFTNKKVSENKTI